MSPGRRKVFPKSVREVCALSSHNLFRPEEIISWLLDLPKSRRANPARWCSSSTLAGVSFLYEDIISSGPDWKTPSVALPIWFMGRERCLRQLPFGVFLPGPGGIHACLPGGGVYLLLASFGWCISTVDRIVASILLRRRRNFNSDLVADMFFIWLLMWPLPTYSLIGD